MDIRMIIGLCRAMKHEADTLSVAISSYIVTPEAYEAVGQDENKMMELHDEYHRADHNSSDEVEWKSGMCPELWEMNNLGRRLMALRSFCQRNNVTLPKVVKTGPGRWQTIYPKTVQESSQDDTMDIQGKEPS